MATETTPGLRHAGSPIPDAALAGMVRQQLLDGIPWSAKNGEAVDGLVDAFAEAGEQGPVLLAGVVAALGAEDPLLRGQAVDFLLRIGPEAPAEAIAQVMKAHRPRLDGQRHPERTLLYADLYDCLLVVLTASAKDADSLAIETMAAGAAAGRPGALGLARLRPARLLAQPSLLPRRALGGALLKMTERADRVALIQALAPFPDADTLLPEAYWHNLGPEGAPLRALIEAHRAAGPPTLIQAADAALQALPEPPRPEAQNGAGQALADAIDSLSAEQRAALLGPRSLMSPEAFAAALAPAADALRADNPAAAAAGLRGLRAALASAPSAGELGPLRALLEAAEDSLSTGDGEGDLDAVAARLAAMVGPRLHVDPRAKFAVDDALLRGLLGAPGEDPDDAAALRARVRAGIDGALSGFKLKPLGPS